MRRRLGAAGLVLTFALGASACTDSGSSDDASGGTVATGDASAGASLPEPELYQGTEFYAEPEELPDVPHGTLIRYQPFENVQVETGTMWRIMYTSEDVDGNPIAVTGVAGVPHLDPPAGGRGVVTLAHGTTGIADECAPSQATGRRTVAPMPVYLNGNRLTVESDYEGMGTSGRHPFLVGESEGHGVLDAALAARQLPDAAAGTQLAIYGYSQGGHAALWAGQLAPDWAPEFQLVGTVAGAPATELPLIFDAASRGNALGFGYMMIAGFHDAYPDAPLSSVLTPAGEDELDAVDDGCIADVLGHFAALDSTQLMVPDGAATEPWASLAEQNNPGNVLTASPILIVHSAADDVVPVALSAALFDRMCSLGQVVERHVYEDGDGHAAAAQDANLEGFDWIEKRFSGQPATSTCPPPGG